MSSWNFGLNIPLIPYVVFDLPPEIRSTLQLKAQITIVPDASLSAPESPSLSSTEKQDVGTAAATSCGLCGLTFASLSEQRSHVRSDLHGYNLKQRIRGKKPVSEVEFERLVGELDESISGSDSSQTEDESEEDIEGKPKPKDSTLSAILKRQAKIADGDAEDAPSKKRKRGSGKPPLVWFSTPTLPSNTSLGIYRAIFSQVEQEKEDQLPEVVKRKQLEPKSVPGQKPKVSQEDEGGVPLPSTHSPNGSSISSPHYFLCMIGGGHFAGMLVSLTPKLNKKSGAEDRSAIVIAHKTFHRYTTRRKQGGAQSANDNSKTNAHSAGSSLRRYNEVALTDEVRALLSEWKTWIDTAELLFVRATGSTNRRTLFGPYDGQVLNTRDERIRGFPFSTRRATQSELMRAFVELTRVKVSTIDEVALLAKHAEEAAAAMAASAEIQTNGKPAPSKPSKPSKEDEEASMHTTQLQALLRRSKAPGLVSYIQSNHLSPDFRFFPAEHNHHAPTPLHLAAANNSPACVTSLLVKIGADPSIRNDDSKTAFELAGDRATRDAFRLARSQLGEDRWSWDAAGVPSALSQADADARAAREKEDVETAAAAEKQRRQAETERLRREDVEKQANNRDAKFGKGHILERPQMTPQERRMEEAKGMTEEMRARLEREKRARAAEERMKRLQGR